MALITYLEPNGRAVSVNVPDGWSLMQGAIANGVEGIVGECGGSCACATCHCYVDESRLAQLPAPQESELALLESVSAPRQGGSRLACQLKAGPDLEGLVLRLPESQY